MKPVLLLLAALLLAPAGHAAETGHSYPEARPFATASGPKAEVKAALERAAQTDKLVMLVFGTDACHDSRGLAGWFATPRFAAMMKARYEIIWIDVGPDRMRHQSLAKRYGVAPIVGTPTVLVLDARGAPLNLGEAGGWRNAASRSADAIFEYFAALGNPA